MLALPTAAVPGSTAAAVTYVAGLAVIVVGLVSGSRRCSGAARRGWSLIALASICWLVGDVLQRLHLGAGTEQPVIGAPDVFWLGSYPLLVTGVVVMLRARHLDRRAVRELALDVLAVTAVAGCVAWQLLVAPELAGSRLTSATALAVLYPLGDVALFALGLALSMAPGQRGRVDRLVVGCLAGTLVIDSLFAVLPVVAPSVDVNRLDAVLLMVNALLGAAAVDADAGRIAAPGGAGGVSAMNRGRIVVLGCALVALSVATQLVPPAHTGDRVVATAAATVLSVSVVLRFYAVVRDRERAERQLLHQATHDQLTGLANRWLLRQELDRRLASSALTGDARSDVSAALTVLYVDLDGFKQVNDTHGHDAGDVVLKAVSERLQACTRAGDTVARAGGDEFVVVCPDLPREQATSLAHRIHDAVGAPIPWGDQALRISASIGCSWLDLAPSARTGPRMDAEAVLLASDRAMYQAKSTGSRVIAADLSPA